jgi:hypothetical protein
LTRIGDSSIEAGGFRNDLISSIKMPASLFLNGVFEAVLAEIDKVQKAHPETLCYLQPYDADRMVRLAESPPTAEYPMTLYVSLTDSLNTVRYRAKIVNWQDKRKMDQSEIEAVRAHLAKYQPNEKEGIYLSNVSGKECVNLISVRNLKRLPYPFPVSRLIKTEGGTPLKDRTQAGKWSYVEELPDSVGMVAET